MNVSFVASTCSPCGATAKRVCIEPPGRVVCVVLTVRERVIRGGMIVVAHLRCWSGLNTHLPHRKRNDASAICSLHDNSSSRSYAVKEGSVSSLRL